MEPIFDLHCHPSIKVYLCSAQIAEDHHSFLDDASFADFIPGRMHVDLPGMDKGGVQCIVSFQYVPEVGITKMPKAHAALSLLKRFNAGIVPKMQQDTDGDACFQQALSGIKALNEQARAAAELGAFDVVTPKSSQEFEDALSKGQTIILHGLEGSHHLGRNLGSTQAYLDHLQAFKEAGVVVLTLAHFFINDVTGSGGGNTNGCCAKAFR